MNKLLTALFAGAFAVSLTAVAQTTPPAAPAAAQKPKPVEELRSQLPFLRVHRTDQYEPCGLARRHTITLYGYPSAGSSIKQ